MLMGWEMRPGDGRMDIGLTNSLKLDRWSDDDFYPREIMQAPGSRMYIATHKILFLFFLSKMVKSLMAILGWLCNGVQQKQLKLNSLL